MGKMLPLLLILLILPSLAMGALISTDSTYYPPEDSVYITGSGYAPNETVVLQVTRFDGTILPGESGQPWYITSDEYGNLQSFWITPYTDYTVDTMIVMGTGDLSGEEGDAIFVVTPTKNIDHLQNGTISAPPNWSNGNINSSNSCYGEARSIPYRYFIKGLTGGTQHYFTISCEWTKGGIHGFDYFTDYDLTEAGPIAAAGGSCGNISTPPPTDCQPISGSYAFPDPTNTANYTGTIPPDFFPAGFVLDGPRNLSFYNLVVDSISKYWFAGTSSDREYLVTIYFTVQNTGSIGFYWGGHQAQGTASTWGVGNGTASISGAPIHMRAGDFDGDGGFVDMSVQTGDACFPPDVTITCSSDSVCTDSIYTCSAPAGAADYTWSISGGTILSGQGTESITYTVTAGYPGTIEITLDACNYTDGCATDLCCASETIYLPVGNCCDPPEAVCPGDTTILVCDLSQICLPGFSCNGTATVIGGTLNGNEVCFAPVEGTNTITLICTNDCGDADTCTTNVNVVLNSAPVCNLPSDATYFICSDSAFRFPVSATDVDGNLTGCTMTSGVGSFDGSTWTFTATASGVYSATFECSDDCGATCGGTVNVTVNYNAAPVITCPPDITIDCNGSTDPSSTGYATATDDHDPNPSITYADSETGNVITRTWTATDECGASAQCVQTITIEDTTPPTLTCPNDATVQCPADIPPVDIGSVTVSDDCDPDPVVTHISDVSDGNTCPEVITRTYRATDESGNYAECQQIITIDDTEAPVITCPADISVDCNDPTDPSYTGYATATDNCDTDIDITYADTPNGGGFYRTWVATDDCGNAGQCVQTITIDDTTPPTLTCPNDAIVQCPGDIPPVDIGSVTVSDDCDPSPVVTHIGDVSDGNTCPEVITRTYRATDASGNYAECQQIITIDDTEAPVITCPANITIDCNASTDPSNTGTATATDNCDQDIDISYSDVTNGNVITRTWTAVDDCDNFASCDQIITIEDTTPPTLTCPNNLTIQCPGGVPPVDIGSVTVSDDCDPNPVVTHISDVSDGNTCPEIITRTYRATDESGNYAECQQIITIDDTQAPVITCPADITVDCTEPTDPSYTGHATAQDNCDQDIDITYSDATNNNVITRTWIATDDCDNSASCIQTVTIEPNSPPVCNVPNDTTIIQCDDITICLPVSAADPDDNLVGCEITSGPGELQNGEWCYSTSGTETINVTIKCTDECGEFCEESFQVTFIINVLEVSLGDTACVYNGTYIQTPVMLENDGASLGGFELLITYDPTAFTFIEALRGDAIADWEYFTYRTGPFSNCGTACPSGMILIVALADVNNGLPHPPESAFEPSGVIAWLRFYVTENREFGGQSFPLGFFWMDCTNNMFSSRTGDTVYVDKIIYSPFGVVSWDESDDVNFPESERIFGLGAPDECLIGDKTAPIRCIIFHEGYLSICHPDSIDVRGDLNLNNIANEIGDAVLYTNYFIYGMDVFIVNLRGQIAASDVNADGKTLTVGDLVYLIRILNGDAAPFPKLAPFVDDAAINAISNGRRISITSRSDVDLGAIRLSFEAKNANIKPAVELADDLEGFEVLYDIVDGYLNVLVYSFGKNSIPAGINDVITITGDPEYELVSAEASDYNGSEVNVFLNKTEIPREFALSQNYPNPFNPETEIMLSLPESGNWTLEIYNIKGQVVRHFEGYSDAGTVTVIWDSKDDYGSSVASGIYFYRGTAGDKHSLTRKMVLIK